ncbi:MAG: hypothetical protein J6A96_05170 [Clostridia bacterium]|nr:hypothetical protein [Clostridia bacterium]
MKKYVAPTIEIERVSTEDIMSISNGNIVSVTQDENNTNAGSSFADLINKFFNDNL